MMKLRNIIFILATMVYSLWTMDSHAQQTILVFTETFENYNGSFQLNAVGNGANNGDNQWIINNEYDGQNIYPNTIRQDSVTSGTITNAPFSTYMHIHDAASGINNANYNPATESDRFTHTTNGFCTLGLTDVTLDFFYLAEGNADSYGEFFFSINGGTWQKGGQAKYIGQSKWKFERITNPAFDNVNDLRFGFRWVNNNQGGPYSASFSVDDIILVGNYDAVNNPITITIPQLFPNPICRLNNLILQYSLSQPLCNGTYEIQLSNAQGNFNNPIGLGVFGIGSLDSSGFIAAQIPGNIPLGTCYKVRISRLTPQPQILGESSICINVQNCPNIINTQSAVVTTDPDTVCSRSAIDIKFTSTGIYTGQNKYIAELSDSAGNFTNPLFIGELPSTETFDPAIGAQPGTVSGLIPTVPNGCNYFIRVRSTSPSATGSLFGPFCIKQCDIETNLTQDIQICVKENEGFTDTVEIVINYWDSIAGYNSGNRFIVQLLDMMTLAVVNEGALGIKVDTASGDLILTVPGRNQLAALGIAPGSYYMRIIADGSTTPYNSNGTIVRITIGAPNDVAATIVYGDTVQCNTNIVTFTVVPWNQESAYDWYSNGFNPNPVRIRDSPSILVNFNGAQPDQYSFFVREENYGCFGPFSDVADLYIISSPNVNITGPEKVCLGDTVNFNVLFITETFYDWAVTNGTVIDTANNEITVVFNQLGTATIALDAVNKCGSQSGSITIEVISPLDLIIYQDTTVCRGAPVNLNVETPDGINKSLTTIFNGSVTRNGTMFKVKALFDVLINSFEVHLGAGNNYNIAVYYLQDDYAGNESNSGAWTLIGNANAVTSAGLGRPTLIPLNINIPISGGDTYSFYITVTNNNNLRLSNGTTIGALYKSDGILELYEGTATQYLFGAFLEPRVFNGKINYSTFAGLIYNWSNGATTQNTTIFPTQNGIYTVTVSDSTGCGNNASVTINVLPTPEIFAGNDTVVCFGGRVPVNAIAGNTFTWQPTTGIENPNSLNTIIQPEVSTLYTLQAADPNTGCIGRDSLYILVTNDEGTVDSTQFCLNDKKELKLPQSFNNSYLWSNGETTQAIMVSATGTYIGQYTKDVSGCIGKVAIDAEAIDCEKIIKVADAFTPNNDGSNDFFTVFGKNIVQYEIRIFNRWGEQVYYSNDPNELNDLSKGWDGTHKGQLQNTAVFVYYITAKDINNISVEKKGNLTLIR
jgi:gliding motility-associated-like protein